MTCPNCGRERKPDTHRAVTADRITFYNCPACDFSSWDLDEYLPGLIRNQAGDVIGEKDISDREFLGSLL